MPQPTNNVANEATLELLARVDAQATAMTAAANQMAASFESLTASFESLTLAVQSLVSGLETQQQATARVVENAAKGRARLEARIRKMSAIPDGEDVFPL